MKNEKFDLAELLRDKEEEEERDLVTSRHLSQDDIHRLIEEQRRERQTHPKH